MGLSPRLWASLVPRDPRHPKPNHYVEMARVAWQNRAELSYAWRILTQGCCDGCALGTTGMRDWTLQGIHLCMVRLELLRLNTMPALDPARLADASKLERLSSQQLRELGRLAEPMLRRRGEPGFRVVSWDEAHGLLAERVKATPPERVAFYLTSRGILNEHYYVAQKAARAIGTNHVDNSARLCHAASTVAMKRSLGHGATTCSYTDWIGSDLVVLFGSNVANNQPVTLKYLYEARKRGTRVAVVNTYREPGLERYWVPSVPESAVFGTRVADEWFAVDTGGDLAFLLGVFKLLVAEGWVDSEFVARRTSGFEQARAYAAGLDLAELERASGTTRAEMRRFAELLRDAPRAVLVWSMGLTQHVHGVETIEALVNVGLARGYLGREKAGLMPIRGHSGVQGGAEVGCVPALGTEQRARFADCWGFPLPEAPGLTAAEMPAAAARGELDVLFCVGGNFLETLPDPRSVAAALDRVATRAHHDIVTSSMMLLPPSDLTLLLPATTRYESPGGGTETSTERRIIFSPEVPGRRVGSARPEWQVLGELAARVRPELAEQLRFASAQAIREEIARAVPLYAGIEKLERAGQSLQWGGPRLYADGRFGTADGKARFSTPRLPQGAAAAEGRFRLSTRRGKQFNSMLQRSRDPLNDAARDDVLIAPQDALRLGLAAGDRVRLRSSSGSYVGRVRLAPVKPGNLEVHWPEGNVLLARERLDPASHEPDYNASVSVERA
jgi:molybdopterin-dependent oxidoreductase alpha subunit